MVDMRDGTLRALVPSKWKHLDKHWMNSAEQRKL